MNPIPTAKLSSLDTRSVLHPHSNLKKQSDIAPIIMTGGSGIYVIDDSGKRYLDSAAGLGNCPLGFNNERLAKAAYEAMRKLGAFHVFRNISNVPAIELSDKLISLAPVPMAKVLIQSSGSEANDTAVKLAWYYWHALGRPEKRKIISREGSYHGATCVTTSLCGSPVLHRGFGLPFAGFLKTEPTNYYRHSRPAESEEQFTQRLADSLEALIQREGPETIGAFVADAMQANSGGVVPPKGYWAKVQAILKKYEILLILDEVVTGFGRTGNVWAAQTFGIEPDLLTTAKALSAGMQPISALLISDRIYKVMVEESDKFGAFWHGYTWTGHPVACAVALETLRIYEEEDIQGRIRAIGPFFQEQVATLQDHPLVGSYSGLGLFAGLDLTDDRKKRSVFGPESRLNARLTAAALNHRMFLRVLGNLRIHFSPPFIITEDDVVEMVKRSRMALDDVYAQLQVAP